ncbi:hypothetical protein EK21DRAFT_112317 [Setomelanomma holmii]|uniref:Uncharacterized protein n=1 Tax=Setomelanomma holmii TaxID=210430 RepID=A0A9P4HA73_9PLEO|nr:hypothetical protein EK21DRAFT_112317 [Setomelanomma holmii]
MAPRKEQKNTSTTGAKVAGARIEKKRNQGPVMRYENGLVNINRKSGKHMLAIKHNAATALPSLPAEIRNSIWELVLGGNVFSSGFLDSRRRGKRRTIVRVPKNFFSMLQDCRQLYVQTCLVPFASNMFSFDDADIVDWAYEILPFQRKAIKEIRIVTSRADKFLNYDSSDGTLL